MDILFRASSVSDLMGVKGLGLTGQKRAITTYLENKYNRSREFSSKYTDKGNQMEPSAIEMVARLTGLPLFKNVVRLHNEFITGEADCVLDETIVDIKNSWDLVTFSIRSSDYSDQMQCYMELYDKPTATVAYCLQSAPDDIIERELKGLTFKYGDNVPEWEEIRIVNNLVFDKPTFLYWIDKRDWIGEDKKAIDLIENFVHIPEYERIALVKYERDQKRMELIEERVTMAREFIKQNYIIIETTWKSKEH
jgi:hypothetical protein